jgi:cytochrome c-type biogenesis protein CcmH
MRALLIVAGLLAALALAGPAAAAERCSLAQLEGRIMCPTCKGQTLAESTAASADRIREQIAVWSDQGLTCSQIQERLVDEFGDGILASPPASGFGLLAWVLPLAGLALGAVVVGLLAWRWSRNREDSEQGSPRLNGKVRLDPELERKLDEELARFD